MITRKINVASVLRDLKKYRGAFERTVKEVVDTEARGAVKDGVQATPPFYSRAAPTADNPGKWETVGGSEAKKAGERKVESDAAALFVGKELKGKRMIPHLFGDYEPDVGNKPPYYTPTTERYPHPSVIWAVRLKRKFESGARRIGRGRKQAYYVEQRKLNKAIRERKRKVGNLAAGWNAAAAQLGVQMPAWIKRHGSKNGRVTVRKTATSYSIRITNSVPYSDRLALQRIIDRVQKTRQGKLERRLPHVLNGALRRARLESMRVA
jgi:hypothetical protein